MEVFGLSTIGCARVLEIISLAGSKATFESAATNCGKSESEAAEPLSVVKAIFARLGDLPLYHHRNHPAEVRDRAVQCHFLPHAPQ
jgi:hypothetical protein